MKTRVWGQATSVRRPREASSHAGEAILAAIVPTDVETVEAFGDTAAVLLGTEKAAAAVMARRRRQEFATGRACAHRALQRLGHDPCPVPVGPSREPRWPTGVVGSITHCAGYRAAAVADARRYRAVGIDAEPHEPLPAGVEATIARPEEIRMLRRISLDVPDICWDRLLFSAKESAFKAWFPLTRRWLSFEDASICISPEDGSFTTNLLSGPNVDTNGSPLGAFAGRWRVARQMIATCIVVPAHGAPDRV
jgi:4'-phosphopantetheinyl transferase EntD